ncbi:MAG: DUF4270 domain-containing protein [Paludibacter sp.]
MKSQPLFLLILLSVLTFSCADDLTNYGSGIQPKSDEITLGADTFHLTTENIFVDFMYSKPDSFLLGTFYNEKFGTNKADVLAQVNCPVGFKFPPLSVPDSALVVLYYDSWFGDSYAPLDVNVYEMNKKTFNYTGLYPTNLNPIDYTDLSVLLGRRVFTAKDATKTRVDSTLIMIKLSNDFVQKFYNDALYSSETAFQNFFKGIYITANYGASTILNVYRIDLEYYYHYTYTKPGANTVTTVNNVLIFPANKEVRQVNRFLHPDREIVVKQRDSVNYVSSPANLQTRINLPLKRIKDTIDAKIAFGKKQILNNAILQVKAVEVADSTLEMPILQYMLLIKETEVTNFFEKNKIPTSKDTVALLGQIARTEIGTTGKYEYSYSYDIAALIANELKQAKEKGVAPAENLSLVLVPVSVSTTTSSTSGATTISAVKQQYLMGGVTIRSGKVINPASGNKVTEPMHLKLVYSGF